MRTECCRISSLRELIRVAPWFSLSPIRWLNCLIANVGFKPMKKKSLNIADFSVFSSKDFQVVY